MVRGKQMANTEFSKSDFLQAAGRFREWVADEHRLSELTGKTIGLLGDAVVSLVASCRETGGDPGQLLTALISETSVQVKGGSRSLLVVPANGVGSDEHPDQDRPPQACLQIMLVGQ